MRQHSDILAAQRQSGERSWRNHHYLRGSIYCAECGRRLFFTRARGRHGGLYDYFICGGRTASICKQPHHRVEAVEAAIERHYTTVELTDSQRERIRNAVHTHVSALAQLADKETSRARAEVIRLDNEERKILSAHYADKISDVGPGPKASYSRNEFAPDGLWQEYEVARLYESSGRRATYLGDWHSHPNGLPTPSRKDHRTARSIARHEPARIPRPLMLIVASNDNVRRIAAFRLNGRRLRQLPLRFYG